jgi:predicted NBD/HSP70 family sugar kinase
MTAGPLCLGVDLGGTKIEAAVLDAQGAIQFKKRIDTPAQSPEKIVAAIADLVMDAEHHVGAVLSVGVGTPGAISARTGLLKNANTQCLNGFALKEALEEALQRPVAMANDANCFALSEAVDGAAREGEVVFGVILGTGVGGGVVFRKSAWPGKNAIAGEWGHNPLPWPNDDERPGPDCYCGRRGCIEAFLSGPALATDHLRVTGERLDARAIAAQAQAGEDGARQTLMRHQDRLARALAHVVNILDPDVVVLGGGLSNLEGLVAGVKSRWAHWVFSDQVDTHLVKNLHGDSSGVRGAAWLGGL